MTKSLHSLLQTPAILSELAAELQYAQASLRARIEARKHAADLGDRASGDPDSLSALQPYPVGIHSELPNALGELAEPGSVFRINAHASAASPIGQTGAHVNCQGELCPPADSCVSLLLLGSGDQTAVFLNGQAVNWLHKGGVHEFKLIKQRVPGVMADTLMVQAFGLARRGEKASSWLLDHLDLPKEKVQSLQRVLLAMKPLHQAVFMAAVARADIERALIQCSAQSELPNPLALGIDAAVALDCSGLSRDEASLTRLACLIADLGALRCDQTASSEGLLDLGEGDSPYAQAVRLAASRAAHPLTALTLRSLLERFTALAPGEAEHLKLLLTESVHQQYRIGSKHGPLSKAPMDPAFAAKATVFSEALQWARAVRCQVETLAAEEGEASTATSTSTSAPTAQEPLAGATEQASTPAECPSELKAASSADAIDLDLLLTAARDLGLLDLVEDPAGDCAGGDYEADDVSASGGAVTDVPVLAERERRAYEVRFLPWPRPSLAWAAGMLDGDGCVAIVRQTYPQRNPNYRLVVQVCQNCLQTLKHFRQSVGAPGLIHEVKRRIGHNRQVYTLNYSGPKAVLVLERLRSHLVRKRPEAEVALSFIQKGQVGRRFGPHGVPPQLEAIRTSHYNKLRALK